MIQKRNISKFLAIAITLGVLITLILSGPAQAYTLKLDSSTNSVEKKDKVYFTASMKIDSNEFLNINYFVLHLDNSKDFICKFKVNGEIIRGCNGINITQISSAPYVKGYGYSYAGYNNGEFKFNITLDTKKYPIGTYKTSFDAIINGTVIKQGGSDLTITNPLLNKTLKDCSIRAKGEGLDLNTETQDMIFGGNKLNFYIPLENAVKGSGYITGQLKRTTFEYKFKTLKVLENNADSLFVYVLGDYKVGLGSRIQQDAVIYLNKKTQKVSIIADNINIENMDVTFIKGDC
jgi:hypothetical protein